jgi:hypothetical protein
LIGLVGSSNATVRDMSGDALSSERPPLEAVPLFWSFVIEKYGIRPPSGPHALEPMV